LLTRRRCATSPTCCAPAHLAQLRAIVDDKDASPNDHFVALELLRNANIAAGGVLPGCQDTGTAIVMGKRGQHVLTRATTRRRSPAGVRYLRRDQPALLAGRAARHVRGEEHRQQLPAQIELYAIDGDEYHFLFMAKGGGSANKSMVFQETKALLKPGEPGGIPRRQAAIARTAACPPYHLAIVIGGTSAEYALKDRQARVGALLDELPARATRSSGRFRTSSGSARCSRSRAAPASARSRRKYFCMTPRVIRLPRHAPAVRSRSRCRARRIASARKITRDGCSSSSSTGPARYLPDTTHDDVAGEVKIDLTRRMRIRQALSRYPIRPGWCWRADDRRARHSRTPSSRSGSIAATGCRST